MPDFLGIDTSNYTTSCAVYIHGEKRIVGSKRLLPVKSGECGLRQSDAVFHHTNQLSGIMSKLDLRSRDIKAVGVSTRPRNVEGSYMPCFLVGKTAAEVISMTSGIPVYHTSHQIGHIMAALYSCGRLDLMNERFIAFHVSGGTTDCLLCTPDKEEIIKAELFSTSLDLKAGQAVDRAGVMLGLDFPCGIELEKLAVKSGKSFRHKIKLKGNDCCLSGVENKCRHMMTMGGSREDIAKYCLTFIGETIKAMTQAALSELGDLPIVYAGGVMSDKLIADMLRENFEANFAQPEYSCDNASGVALVAYEKYRRKL